MSGYAPTSSGGTVTDGQRRGGWTLAAFALGYLVAAYLGRLTVLDTASISLIWPAAGVSVLWLLGRAGQRYRWLDIAVLATVTALVAWFTGVAWPQALLAALATSIQAVLCAIVLKRWCPELWAGRGHRAVSRIEELWWLLLAAVVGAAVSAPVAGLAVVTSGAPWSWNVMLLWTARNAVSIITICTLGLLVGSWWGAGAARSRTGLRRGEQESAPLGELVASIVLTPLLYVVWFVGLDHIGLVFPLLAMTVWAGSRQSTGYVVLHNTAVAFTAVTLTLLGVGPFLTFSTPTTQVAVAQLYVGLVCLIGLALALAREERARLVREVASARDKAQSQAALLSTIVDTMAEGVRVVDMDGRVLVRNPAATRLLLGTTERDGLDDDDLGGLRRLDGSPLPSAELPYRLALAGHTARNVDLLVKTPGLPAPRVVAFTTAQIPSTSGGGVVTVLRDVTHEREELRRAAQVQASLLPARAPLVPGYELAARFVPAGSVGGDFYDWQPSDDGVVITLADVMGKGTGAAILAAMMRSALHARSDHGEVAASLAAAERAMAEDLASTGAFITLFRARLSAPDGTLTYVDAGHGLTLVVRADGRCERLVANGLPVGVDPLLSRSSATTTLDAGDLVVCFSDGVLDAVGGSLSDLSEIERAVRGTTSAEDAADAVVALAAEAGLQPDDLTVLTLRRQ